VLAIGLSMVDAGCWRHATFVLDASVSSFVPETAFHEWPSLKPPRTRRPNLQSCASTKVGGCSGTNNSQSRPAQRPRKRNRS
jgi:hypothetical protein